MKSFAAYWPSNQAVRWRTLSWKEYRKFRQLQQANPDSSMEVGLALYRAVCLEGPDPEEVTAGIVDYLTEFCLENNPFSGRVEDIQRAVAIKRGQYDYLTHARALVAGLFHYSFEEIDTWDADMFFERVVQAESLAGRPLDPLDPEAEKSSPNPSGSGGETPPKVPKRPPTASQQMAIDRTRNSRR